ncbi:unnamed protein product [Ambrosiozyma monospora]|uniref:Unnamed protein product n=1 Tax=Ambrosiozyma monospora TaxID=43982 RepID=A0ACB5U8I4_AMBMO|nr:unnamed protein product [Ambrosiozyma monospora]
MQFGLPSGSGSRSLSRSGSSSSGSVDKHRKSSSHSQHSSHSTTASSSSIKDIQVGIFAQFPESLNVALPLTSIPITIKFPQVSNLEPDYVHHGKSTKLGLFEVKIVIIRLTQNLYIRCKGHSYKCTKDSNLVYHQRHSSAKRFQFDIKDFTYSEVENCYIMNVTLADLIKNHKPLVEILKKPVMGSIDLPGYFRNTNTLIITMVVGSSQLYGCKSLSYMFSSAIPLTCSLYTTATQQQYLQLQQYHGPHPPLLPPPN